MGEMTKTERNDLGKLIRQREKLMKTATTQRSAELLADFERQLGTVYHFDDDEIWKEAEAIATRAVTAAQAQITDRCEELGIPREFAPSINSRWFDRGQNASRERRAELRKMAQTRIAALERTARTQIETLSVAAQTELIAGSLASLAAKEILAQLPSAESLMPRLDMSEVRALVDARPGR